MSELQSESAVPEAVGSGDPEWDSAGVEAGTLDPTPEPVAEVVPESETAPEPVAEAPDEDYTFTTLESGQKELRLSTGEVYRGKDDAEVARNLAKGKVEANRYIQQLKAPVAAPVPVQQTPAAPIIDPAAQAIADFTAQGLGFKDATEMKALISQFREQGQQSSQMNEELSNQREAISFLRATPDYVNTPTNGERIDSWLGERQLKVTTRNMQDAYYALKGQGMLEGTPVAAVAAAPRKNAMPLPPSGNSPLSTSGGPVTLDDIEKMDVTQLEEFMNKQYASAS